MSRQVIIADELKFTAQAHLGIIVQHMYALRADNSSVTAKKLLDSIGDAYTDHHKEDGSPALCEVEGGDVVFDIVEEGHEGKPVGLVELRQKQHTAVFLISEATPAEYVILFKCHDVADGKSNATLTGRKSMHAGLTQAILDAFISFYEGIGNDVYMPLLHLSDATLHKRRSIFLSHEAVDRCMDLLEANESTLAGHTWFELVIPNALQSQIGLSKIRIYDETHLSGHSAGNAMRFSTVELYPLDSKLVTYSCLNWQQVLHFLIHSGISDKLSISIKE